MAKQINIIVVKEDFSPDGVTPEALDPVSEYDAINAVTNMLQGINSGASDGAAYIGFMYNGTPSRAVLTVDGAVNGDTVTIGSLTLEAGVDFEIGGNDESTLTNLMAVLSATALQDLVRFTYPEPNTCEFISLYLQNLSFINTSGTGGFSFENSTFEGFNDFGYKICNIGLNPDPENQNLFLG